MLWRRNADRRDTGGKLYGQSFAKRRGARPRGRRGGAPGARGADRFAAAAEPGAAGRADRDRHQ